MKGTLEAELAASPCPVQLWTHADSVSLVSSKGDGQRLVLASGHVPGACSSSDAGEGSCRLEWTISADQSSGYAVWARDFHGAPWEAAPRQLWFGHVGVEPSLVFVGLWGGPEQYEYATPSGPRLELIPELCEGGLFLQPSERRPTRLARNEHHFEMGWWDGARPTTTASPTATKLKAPKLAPTLPARGSDKNYVPVSRATLKARNCTKLSQPGV